MNIWNELRKVASIHGTVITDRLGPVRWPQKAADCKEFHPLLRHTNQSVARQELFIVDSDHTSGTVTLSLLSTI